ncbi:hypothetical protein GCM10009604_04170 [Corynebacterium aurimucosum]|uniref:hypothetical protein n=1 Tax=Corynebacterium aurimucosum TaxID=169292 RepID=UPI00191E5079|nr:hypothetical protein [Corynebacterium aurimucosum]QQU96663.1 hypothetical protein I6I66_06235 [Corynebacterium aurimucosum]UTA70485.1 hypothetical protein J3S22_06630 [Corynebacterium aurimucosum]WJY71025.1 hypothetical protein CAURIM_09635 [Corynebacterium aurimucosum]
MSTLADMTPTERAECVGMWGNHTFWGQVLISITDGVQFRGANVEVIRFIDGRPVREWAGTSEVTPRPDLPRAWTPDGQPPAGAWEDDYTDSEGSTLTTGEDLGIGPHQEIRRWIGEWKTIEEEQA